MAKNQNILLVVRDVSRKSAGLSISTFLRAKALNRIDNFSCSLLTNLNTLDKNDFDLINKYCKEFKLVLFKEIFPRIPCIFSFYKIFENVKKSSVIYIYSFYQPISYITLLLGITLNKEIWFRPHGSLMPEYTKKFHPLKNLYTHIELFFYSFSKYILFSSLIEKKYFNKYVQNHIRSRELISKGKITTDSYEKTNLKKFINTKNKSFFDHKNREIDLLFLSRLTRVKGIFIFLDALCDLCNDLEFSTQINILIAGLPTDEFLKKYYKIKKLFANKNNFNVNYNGNLSEEDKWNIFFNSKNFILPTLSDSFGIAAIEALSANVNVASTRMLGCSNIIDSLESFTYLNPEKESIKKYIKSLLKNQNNNKSPDYNMVKSLINNKMSINNQSLQYSKLLKNKFFKK